MATFTPNYNLAMPDVNSPTDEDLWGDELNSNMAIIDSTMKSISDSIQFAVPVGTMFDYAGPVAPTNYMFPYGQAINRVTYAALFALIGTTYGAGDGTSTFNLPDVRGRVTAGRDDMGGASANRLTGLPGGVDGDVLGASGGLETHSLTANQNGAHTHGPGAGNDYMQRANSGQLAQYSAGTPSYFQQWSVTTGSSGNGDPHNNVQPTFIINKIIKVL